MTNEELKKQRDIRTDDLISQIQRHDKTITNIVKSAYERGYADGKRDSNAPTEVMNITNKEAIDYLRLAKKVASKSTKKEFEEPQERYIVALNLAIKALENEHKKGEWIDLGYALEEYREWGKCSVCGYGMFQSDFCPNCGADMQNKTENTGE